MKNIITLFALILSFIGYSQDNGSFTPLLGHSYIVSGWVKETNSVQPVTYTSSIKVQFLDGTTVMPQSGEFFAAGAIIDGWQRIVGIINVPGTYTDPEPSISIELNCGLLDGDCFFDDIRFFPYNGNLKSFVYDEDTQRLMAELDENNYATFYEYDQEGGLIRVKKETEKGVFTIQETRSNSVKTDD